MTAIEARRAAATRPRVRQFCQSLFAVTELARVGGKAHTLGRLLRAGVPVPDGFVLTTLALDAHLAEHRLLDVAEPELGARVRRAPLPSDVRDELLASAAPLLADGSVVVRSSAVGEDGRTESFAGQLDSVLHVSDYESLERAVTAVWASLWSERVRFYANARGKTPRGMGVVVQRQVDAIAAGVLFTATTGGEMLVEFAPGLADALVAGQVDPGRVAIARESGATRVLQPNEAISLDARVLAELRAVGLALESELGGPQDVEWALACNGQLFVVQSRPITAPVTLPNAVASFERKTVKPLNRSTVSWSNANVNENFPRPISPLLYSIASAGYTHYFRNLAVAFGVSRARVRAMEPAFERIIGVHGARMYYNLTSIHSVLRLAPFGRALTASFDTFVGAEGDDVEPHAAAHNSRFAQAVEVAVIAVKAARQFLRLEKRVARFERTVDDFASRTSPSELSRMSLGQLRAALAEFVEIRCHKWLDASLADAASMIWYGALKRLLDGCDASAHTSLLKAIPDVVSGEPVLRLWDLSRLVRADAALRELIASRDTADALTAIRTDARFAEFRAAFDAFVDEWGFRCSEELMLTTPSFQENRAPLVDMLRAYAGVDGDSPRDALRRQTKERERETRRIRRDIGPWRAALLSVVLPRTHAAIRCRERARLKQALLYSRCRRIALAMGAELVARETIADRDDVFFFTHQELLELTAGTAMFAGAVRATIDVRKVEHARLSATAPPDAFTLGDGEYLVDDEQPPAVDIPHTTGSLTGISACAGKATGRATVLRDVTEAERLTRGDVLVTKQTDPGWGPVFPLISGLVIERGGMLSHGAIIAREFGIPCVVGVKNAMAVIRDGATITVDGDAGAVHVDV